MTFDEQLRQSFGSLADHLREEVSRHLESALPELSGLVRERADAAAAAALASASSAVPEPDVDSDGEALERLLDATRSIDTGRSLTEVLDTLVHSMAREAPRAGVLILRDTTLHAWRFSGFDSAVREPFHVDIPLEQAGTLAEAVRTMTATPGQAPPSFAKLPAGHDCLAVPMVVAGQVVAVAYADRGSEPRAAISNAAIEVIVRHAARALEALIALKAARALAEPTDQRNRSSSGAIEAASDKSTLLQLT